MRLAHVDDASFAVALSTAPRAVAVGGGASSARAARACRHGAGARTRSSPSVVPERAARAGRSIQAGWEHDVVRREAESTNTYVKVRWHHENAGEPVLLYGELDEERWEVRKVDLFADGHATYADARGSSGDTQLAQGPMPPLSEIGPEFDAFVITREEFEDVFQRAFDAAHAGHG